MDRGSREHFMSLIFENASSVRELVLQFEECEKKFELETVSLRKQILELKEKEERFKVVEEKERKLELLEKSINDRLQEKEKESETEADLTRFVVEIQVKEVVNQLTEKEKSLGLLQDSTVKKHEEVMRELEAKKKEFGLLEDSMEKKHEALMIKLEALKEEVGLVENSSAKKNEGLVKELEGWKEEVGLLSKSIYELSSELEIEMDEYELKQKEESERRKKEAEVMETSIKKLEAMKVEVGLISKSIDEKSSALVMEVNEFELKKTTETKKMQKEDEKLEEKEKELNSFGETIKKKSIALKKKETKFQQKQKAGALMIKEKKKFLGVKEKELEERERKLKLKQRDLEEESKTRKRSRLEFGSSSSLAEKGVIDDDSVIPPGKKQNSVKEHSRNDEEEKETDAVAEHTIKNFAVGQIWALYDPIDYMPRDYARIDTVSILELSVQATRLEPIHNTSNEKPSIPIACGRFKEGTSEEKNHLLFSHEMNPIVVDKSIFINPLIGETWAVFRDWKKTWNTTQRELHKPPYKYDFVQVLSEFDDDQGIAVAYLGLVEGFTSVYQQAEQHGFIRRMISPDEIFRFSHRVPSCKLTGDEEQGAPPGSFQLDPAVLESVM